MKAAILIVEDNAVNRQILVKILSDEYCVLQAANGAEALEQLEQHHAHLQAVILDLMMPVMDGFSLLEHIRELDTCRELPLIVATSNCDSASEKRVLKLGAWDLIPKPYDRDILKFRLHNAIERSQMTAFRQLKYLAEFDTLTGIYSRSKFYAAAAELLRGTPDGNFVFVRFDMDRFKLVNSFFGHSVGDQLLQHIGNALTERFADRPGSVCGRIEADTFAYCSEYTDESEISDDLDFLRTRIKSYPCAIELSLAFGVYKVDDPSLPPDLMYDRATLAAKTCKGSYLRTVAYYESAMSQHLYEEQALINQMDRALAQEQFLIYYQPKYSLDSDRLAGAEALVRWSHPEQGMISPGQFIPVFEKNGFIAKLDQYVWEAVCAQLRSWLDAGYDPQPISVNMSRVTLYDPNVVSILCALVKKYHLPDGLVQLELTESAYMENPQYMKQVVEELRQQHFPILMDDFGSGYSSLNTLKDIDVDILKVDMKFLPTSSSNSKSEKILSSVIRMAGWLGMPVIVEGVETKAQRDFLVSVGCGYAQGYFYSRPLPVQEYESLFRSAGVLPAPADNASGIVDDDALWSSDAKISSLLSGISLPLAIYEYGHGSLERLRTNQAYIAEFGYANLAAHTAQTMSYSELVKMTAACARASENRSSAECTCMGRSAAGEVKWYRLKIQYIRQVRQSSLLCCIFTDISQEKRIESELQKIHRILLHNSDQKGILLIVDDSELSCDLLENIFRDQFRFLRAANGQEALVLAHLHSEEIAVILLDMMMPVMDGAEFLARKNQDARLSGIPVVVISAADTPDTQIHMLRSGVSDYVTKPFVPEVVKTRVNNVVDYSSRYTTLLRQCADALSPGDSGDLFGQKTAYSLKEMQQLLALLNPIFDVVRLVDPEQSAIVSLEEGAAPVSIPYTCFRVWRRDCRCDNCSSRCAQRSEQRVSKYESMGADSFYVISQPVRLAMEGREPVPVVLELVSQILRAPQESPAAGVVSAP